MAVASGDRGSEEPLSPADAAPARRRTPDGARRRPRESGPALARHRAGEGEPLHAVNSSTAAGVAAPDLWDAPEDHDSVLSRQAPDQPRCRRLDAYLSLSPHATAADRLPCLPAPARG